jgi:secondary thiamine-phosphate synthase enzyme
MDNTSSEFDRTAEITSIILLYNPHFTPRTSTLPRSQNKGYKSMASVSAKALDQPAVDSVAGAYRVTSMVAKIQTGLREELHNLTPMVRDFVRSSGIRAGSLIVSSLHTTCAIFINEWQDALMHDVRAYLQSCIAKENYYRHNDPAWSDCDRHNADSHLRSLLLGASLALQIVDGDVVLGEWQSIIMAELDGPRERTLRFQAMGVSRNA